MEQVELDWFASYIHVSNRYKHVEYWPVVVPDQDLSK